MVILRLYIVYYYLQTFFLMKLQFVCEMVAYWNIGSLFNDYLTVFM